MFRKGVVMSKLKEKPMLTFLWQRERTDTHIHTHMSTRGGARDYHRIKHTQQLGYIVLLTTMPQVNVMPRPQYVLGTMSPYPTQSWTFCFVLNDKRRFYETQKKYS